MYAVERKEGDEYIMKIVKCPKCNNEEAITYKDGKYICDKCKEEIDG